MIGDFGTVNPWYYPITSSSPYQFYNLNFYHPPEYTPPPTPPHVYHHIQPPEPPYQFYTIPQPPPYYTPPTSYTCPYLSDSSGIPGYSTNQHEIQARPNPYHPPLTCFTSPFITTTQFPFGVIDEQQPELVVSQVFDESPHSPELIFNSSNDNYHQMYDKFSEIIQKLEEIGKNLADQSRISKEMSSKKVSQSSHTLTHVPIVSNLDKSVIIEKTGKVDSNQQLDILAPHMFDESPENEYVTLDKHFPSSNGIPALINATIAPLKEFMQGEYAQALQENAICALANISGGLSYVISSLGQSLESCTSSAQVADTLGALASALMIYDSKAETTRASDPNDIEQTLVKQFKPHLPFLVQKRTIEALASLYRNATLASKHSNSDAKHLLVGLITMASDEVQNELIRSFFILCNNEGSLWHALQGREGIHLLISLLGLSSEQQQECAVIAYGLDKKATRVCDEKVLIFDPGAKKRVQIFDPGGCIRYKNFEERS